MDRRGFLKQLAGGAVIAGATTAITLPKQSDIISHIPRIDHKRGFICKWAYFDCDFNIPSEAPIVYAQQQYPVYHCLIVSDYSFIVTAIAKCRNLNQPVALDTIFGHREHCIKILNAFNGIEPIITFLFDETGYFNRDEIQPVIKLHLCYTKQGKIVR